MADMWKPPAQIEKEAEIARLAIKMHLSEHPDGDVTDCEIDWHTDTWFEHAAAQVYRTGRRD